MCEPMQLPKLCGESVFEKIVTEKVNILEH